MSRKYIEKVCCSALLAFGLFYHPVYGAEKGENLLAKESENVKEEKSREADTVRIEEKGLESPSIEKPAPGNSPSEVLMKEENNEGKEAALGSWAASESDKKEAEGADAEAFETAEAGQIKDIVIKEAGQGELLLDAVCEKRDSNSLFRWLLYDVNKKEWSVFSDWSSESRAKGTLKSGNYWFHVEMKSADGTLASKTVAYNILSEESKYMDIKGIYAFEDSQGIHAGAVHETNIGDKKFRWLVYDLDKKSWEIVSDWKESNWLVWKPGKGNYWLRVESLGGKKEIVEKTISYKVERSYAKEVNISGIYVFEKKGQLHAGAVHTTNAEDVEFRWLLYDIGRGEWRLVSDWKKDNWLEWLPDKGDYWLRAEARIGRQELSHCTISYRVSKSFVPYFNFADIEIQKSGAFVSAEAKYSSNQEDLEFQWLLYDLQSKEWKLLSDWTMERKSVRISPEKAGEYWLAVKIRGSHIDEFTKINWLSYHPGMTAKEAFTPIIKKGNELVYPNREQCLRAIKTMGPLCSQDQRESGILASVTMAQFILESGFGGTDLAQSANNLFGMKASLSGSNWAGSTWDGVSVYKKQSPEDDGKGNITYPISTFRKYHSIEDSIKDHSAYLRNAKKGSSLRYAGLIGEKDYKKAITIIKNGGYATDSKYIEKICSIIERYNLTQYDLK